MRILHVISSLDPRSGGPAAALAGLAPAQVRCGLQVGVAATWVLGEDVSPLNRLRDQGIEMRLVGPCLRPLCWHWRLHRIMQEMVDWADVVHIHGLWEEIQHQGAQLAWRHGRASIVRPCGMLDPWSLAQHRWKKDLYLAWRLREHLDRATAVHYTADSERDLAAPLAIRAPAIVEPNGVDLAEFENLPPRGSFRARYPALQGRPMVLFLSRLHHKKGLGLLVPAFARARLGDAMLVIAGPDSDGYRAQVEQMVAREGLVERTIFTGMLKGRLRIEAMADADLFVLPSHQENFGIVVVEALASGTPVVISDQVAVHPQVSAAGVGGVAPMDVDALAERIAQWMGDEPMRRRAAAAARPFVWENYDWQRIAQRWADRYGRLCTGRRAG